MQYVTIKREEKDGNIFFIVNAISLKNKNKSVIQKIPHPLGTDFLQFKTLDEAKDAVSRAGFSYVLPDGKKETARHIKQNNVKQGDYDYIVLNVIKDKVNSGNSNVAAAAIAALAEFPCEETFEVLFDKLGEDNDVIRKNAISGICRYGNILQNRIIDSLKSSNWVVRNSALVCIQNLCDSADVDSEKFIIPLTETCNDNNTIVQASALAVLAKVYHNYQKNKAN